MKLNHRCCWSQSVNTITHSGKRRERQRLSSSVIRSSVSGYFVLASMTLLLENRTCGLRMSMTIIQGEPEPKREHRSEHSMTATALQMYLLEQAPNRGAIDILPEDQV